MARSGSENRQRQVALKARFSADEAALVREQAARAGVSVSALIRKALLDLKPLRKQRAPTLDHVAVAQIVGRLGALKSALERAASTDAESASPALIDAVHRDLAELRALLFEALGRTP